MQNTDTTTEQKQELEKVVEDAVKQQQETGAPEPQKEEAQETPEEINWRAVRQQIKESKQREEEERKRKSEERKLDNEKDSQIEQLTKAMSKMMESKGQAPMTNQQQQQLIDELADEDIPTGGEVKSFLSKFVPKLIRETLEKSESERRQQELENEQKNLPNAIKKRHADFLDVVQEENLAYLNYHYPDVANALDSLPDNINKWTSVYNTVKKLVPISNRRDADTVERNMQKPQAVSMSSAPQATEKGYGKTLTQAEKKVNYERLQELARGI
jgi:hypothetical protein